MKISNEVLFAATVCLFGGTLWVSSAQAAQMSIASFPDKLIVSANDNRVIAFIVEKDGVRVPEAQVKASITAGNGTLDTSSCETDESGQCLFSYTAPKDLGQGKVETTASIAGAEDGVVTVNIDVVATPTLSGSGWQCDADAAVYAQIPETIECSDACSLEKDCKNSKCPTSGDIYCHSAQEACACGGIEMVKGAKTQAVDTEIADTAAKTAKPRDDKLIITIALFLFSITGLTYIAVRRKRNLPKD